MAYHVYILYSKSLDRYYVGSSGDLQARLSRHNGGWSKSTKAGVPWLLVFFESFESRALAVRREVEIKKRKKRAYIESLVASFNADLK